MSTLAINLKNMLTHEQISSHELSRRTGVKQPVISRILTGENQNPKLRTLTALSNYFSVSTSQLIGELSNDNNVLWENTQINLSDIYRVSIREWDLQRAPEQALITINTKVSANAFALTVHSSAMEPRFTPGIIIVVDPAAKLRHHDYVVIMKNGETLAQLRRLLVDNNKKYIVSTNPKLDDFYKLKTQDKLIGKVVCSIVDFQDKH